jgi:UDP-N-acetylmuramoyl-L-alanyl-D-glutamate--2,6-diaminopimelate ligase
MEFSGLVFTNISQDHLDFHADMEEYAESKMRLFQDWGKDSISVINLDDRWGPHFVAASPGRTLTFGSSPEADFQYLDAACSLNGASFTLLNQGDELKVAMNFIGAFNVENATAAIASAHAQGVELSDAAAALAEVPPVRGRMEKVDCDQPYLVVIDYAHSPGSLSSALKTLREIEHERIITVFGAGGDRDRTKRPLMRQAAEENSDVLIVTSDNPRSEDPGKIIDEILDGSFNYVPTYREVDRRKAIADALEMARKGDIVLIAGKGHETYQEIHGERFHFDDREVVEEILGGSAE